MMKHIRHINVAPSKNVAFVGYFQYGSVLTNPTLLHYCQYECKAIPNPSSQSSASQEELGSILTIAYKCHICQYGPY